MTAMLTTRESAGLYVVRRARTLTAPHQVRLLVTAFLALLVLDLGRLCLAALRAGQPAPWSAAGAQALVYVAIAVLLWRTLAGLGVAGVALIAGVAVGSTGSEPVLLLIMAVTLAVRGPRRLQLGALVVLLAYLGVNVTVFGAHRLFVLLWYGGALLTGAALGLLLRRVGHRRDDEGRLQAAEVEEDSRLRADERSILARELHDVVTHQLSNVSLQVMSHLDSDDVSELRRVLTRVNRATDSALTELRLLVRVLRDDPVTGPGADEVGELSRRLAPTEAAAVWARTLTGAGFEPAFELPAAADRLEATVQATLSRALDVTCDNVVQHAPARSRASVEVRVNATQVVLRTGGPLPEDGTPVLGWGLRALRERVDLTGGQFSAGPGVSATGEPEWVVTVTLPRD